MIILPRQARDNMRGKTPKKERFITGTCHDVPPGPFANPGPSGCTEDVPDNGEGPDVDGQIHGRPPMLDLPVYKNAITKLQFAAKNLKETKQKFFLNVGIKRPHLVWRVPVGIIREHYHPDSFTPALPQNRVLDPSVNPVAWVPFFDHNPYTPRSVNETLELRRYYYVRTRTRTTAAYVL